MRRYAENTSVTSEKSRMEIEKTLTRYGATSFMFGWEEDRAAIGFKLAGRQIRFILPMPRKDEKRFVFLANGRTRRVASAAEAAWEQSCRQSWRALALIIKAKLEAVAAGIVTLEDEFLANIVLPDGKTAGDWIRPQIAIAYERGDMPKMLPDYGGASR